MIYFIINSKDILIALISSNKHLLCMLLESIWESAKPLCMAYNLLSNVLGSVIF